MLTATDTSAADTGQRPNIFARPAASCNAPSVGDRCPTAVFDAGAAAVAQRLPTLDARRSKAARIRLLRRGVSIAPYCFVALIVASSVVAAATVLTVFGHRHVTDLSHGIAHRPWTVRRSPARSPKTKLPLRRSKPRIRRARVRHQSAVQRATVHRGLRPRMVRVPSPPPSLPVPSASRAPARPAPVPAGALPEFP